MKNTEAKFGILFRHYLKANPQITTAFELKQSSTDSISFSALEEHQSIYLQAIKSKKGVLVRVQGVNGEPDYIYLRNSPACVVVKFPSEFSIIDITTWLAEQKRSKRKSLTVQRAREISINTVSLSSVKKA